MSGLNLALTALPVESANVSLRELERDVEEMDLLSLMEEQQEFQLTQIQTNLSGYCEMLQDPSLASAAMTVLRQDMVVGPYIAANGLNTPEALLESLQEQQEKLASQENVVSSMIGAGAAVARFTLITSLIQVPLLAALVSMSKRARMQAAHLTAIENLTKNGVLVRNEAAFGRLVIAELMDYQMLMTRLDLLNQLARQINNGFRNIKQFNPQAMVPLLEKLNYKVTIGTQKVQGGLNGWTAVWVPVLKGVSASYIGGIIGATLGGAFGLGGAIIGGYAGSAMAATAALTAGGNKTPIGERGWQLRNIKAPMPKYRTLINDYSMMESAMNMAKADKTQVSGSDALNVKASIRFLTRCVRLYGYQVSGAMSGYRTLISSSYEEREY